MNYSISLIFQVSVHAEFKKLNIKDNLPLSSTVVLHYSRDMFQQKLMNVTCILPIKNAYSALFVTIKCKFKLNQYHLGYIFRYTGEVKLDYC